MKRIHIVGCPRSGTTLLMELMTACFKTHRLGKHEVSMFDFLPATAAHEKDVVYLSKNPTDIFHVHKLMQIDPNLHVLYIVRDPRAVVSSLHWSYESYFTNYRIWKKCDTQALALRQHPKFHWIRYEDLVGFPDLAQQYIHTCLPFLAKSHDFSGFAEVAKLDILADKAMNGLRPVDTGSLWKWHKHLARVKDQLERYPQMQQDLQRLDYENDSRWQDMLLRISSIQYRCRDSERPNFLKIAEKNLRVWIKIQRYQQHMADRKRLQESSIPEAVEG